MRPIQRQLEGLREKGLERQHYVLLLLLGAAAFFDGYDTAIKTLALKQIRETFDLSPSMASWMLAVVYVGALPAMVLTRVADRIGRRRVLLWSVVGYTAFSGLTAIAPNAGAFAGLQLCQQIFLVAETALVWTFAAEELPARARGFGFAVLGMAVMLGHGLAGLVFGGIFEPLDISWRWLYVIGVPPLLLVAVLRRRLPESRRFEAARDGGRLVGRWQVILEPPHRRWLVLVVVAMFLLQLATQAGVFVVDYLQSERGVSASMANALLILAGLPGIPLMVAAGSLSDRFGRRIIGCAFVAASAVGGLGLFWLPGGIPVILPCLSVMIVGTMGAYPVMSTFVTELFPTPLRGNASSWSQTSAILGRTASLGIAAVLLELFATSSQAWTATMLGLGPALAVVIVLVFFPDTHGRELEETSGEVSSGSGEPVGGLVVQVPVQEGDGPVPSQLG